MNKKKEKTEEKKLEGVVVKPEESRDLIKKIHSLRTIGHDKEVFNENIHFNNILF